MSRNTFTSFFRRKSKEKAAVLGGGYAAANSCPVSRSIAMPWKTRADGAPVSNALNLPEERLSRSTRDRSPQSQSVSSFSWIML